MTIPNFFHYEIQVKGQKIGNIYAPCKWVAQKSWENSELPQMFPNAKIKFKGLNIQKKVKIFENPLTKPQKYAIIDTSREEREVTPHQ